MSELRMDPKIGPQVYLGPIKTYTPNSNYPKLTIIWSLFRLFIIQKYSKMTAVSKTNLATKCLDFCQTLNTEQPRLGI